MKGKKKYIKLNGKIPLWKNVFNNDVKRAKKKKNKNKKECYKGSPIKTNVGNGIKFFSENIFEQKIFVPYTYK